MAGKIFLALISWSLFIAVAIYFSAALFFYARIRGYLPT